MKFIKFLFVLFLLLVVVGVIGAALFPARLAVQWFGDRIPAVKLEGVGGTVWNGRASDVTVHGRRLGALEWKLAWMPLLSGRGDADLALSGGEFTGSGSVSTTGAQTTIKNAVVEFPAERLQPVLDVPNLVPRGTVQVNIAQAELLGTFPSKLQGTAVWKQATVSGAAEAQFGDLHAEFQTPAGGGIVGTVKDGGGPLILDGSFKADFSGFEAEAILQARDANPQVQEALRYIGQPQPDGSSILQIKGQLLNR